MQNVSYWLPTFCIPNGFVIFILICILLCRRSSIKSYHVVGLIENIIKQNIFTFSPCHIIAEFERYYAFVYLLHVTQNIPSRWSQLTNITKCTHLDQVLLKIIQNKYSNGRENNLFEICVRLLILKCIPKTFCILNQKYSEFLIVSPS